MSFGRLFADLLLAGWSVADVARGYGVSDAAVIAAIDAVPAGCGKAAGAEGGAGCPPARSAGGPT